MLRIKLVKSPTGHTPANRATIKALGLRKVHQVVEKQDTPAVRGMIHRVQHLVVVEAMNGKAAPKGDSSTPPRSARDDNEKKTAVEATTKESKPKSTKPKSEVPKTKAAKSKESQ